MRVIVVVGVVLSVAAPRARASPAADLEKMFTDLASAYQSDAPKPRFAMSNLAVQSTDDDLYSAYDELGGLDSMTDRVSIGLTDDGKAAWLAADRRLVGDCGGDAGGAGCGATLAKVHVSGVFELGKDGWGPVVWNTSTTTSDVREAQVLKDGKGLAAIPAKIEGADAAAALFSSTIGDPKALAKSVSTRKDTLLYGSEDGERFTGAQVAAKLRKWNLAFKVHDGVRAGLSANGGLAWVAANLDATPAAKPKAKPTPYRALFVYLKAGDHWELVQAQFSFGE
jgi:hypothetical protein